MNFLWKFRPSWMVLVRTPSDWYMVPMFAERVDQIKPFVVMEVLARAAELEEEGHRVVHFEVGEPDFPTAEPIVAAGRDALSAGRTKYTQATGIPELRRTISDYYSGLGVSVDPERIIVTPGASGGLVLLAGLLLDPGNELLITDPGYPCNEVFAMLAGGVPKRVAVTANNRFQPLANDLFDAWSDSSRGALLASPTNPTGTMLDPEVLAEIAKGLKARGGFLILDEIYQGLVSSPPYRSGLEIVDDLFVLNSFSKYFGMTGWRLGWNVVPDDAVDYMTHLAMNLFISPSTPAQYAALAAFEPAAMAIHEERARVFRERAEVLAEGLRDLGFTIPVMPDGAFYLYVDISHTGMDSTDFCWKLLNEYQVAITPGEDFGNHLQERFVRFAYTTDEDSIRLGLERIADALDELA